MRRLLAVLAVTGLYGTPALAEPQVNGVFDMPGVQTNGQLTAGPDGNIWVVLQKAVARVTPDGTVKEFTKDDFDKLGAPEGAITAAAGAIWVAQPPDGVQSILKITPGDPPVAESFAVTDVDAAATAMTLGPDGNIWVGVAGKLVKFPPSDPVSSTPYLFTGLQPKAIAAGADGTLWVTDGSGDGQLLNVKTDGTPAHDPYPTGGSPQFLATAPSGQVTVSLPINTPQQIGQLVPGGSLTTIDRPIPADPFGVAFGNDGAFWVAMFAGNRLDRVTTDGQLTSLTGFPEVANQGPRQITVGPGNTLWVTLDNPSDLEETNSKIARITGVQPPPPPGGGTAGGGPPGGGTIPPPDTTPPTVSAVKLSRKKVPAGTKSVSLRFTLSEPGTATIVLSRRAAGRRRGKACVKPTRKLRRAKPCTRLVRAKTLRLSALAGQNTAKLSLRGQRRGRYVVALTVADTAGNRAAPVNRTLVIAARRGS
jgi:virginiamycin B lyase